MNEEQRCPICGLRSGTHISSQTYQCSWGTMTIRYYSGSSTEPYCFGHQETTLCTPVAPDTLAKYAKRAEVPQVFQDAFRDEELQV